MYPCFISSKARDNFVENPDMFEMNGLLQIYEMQLRCFKELWYSKRTDCLGCSKRNKELKRNEELERVPRRVIQWNLLPNSDIIFRFSVIHVVF